MTILIERRDDVAHLTLANEKQRNALSPDDFAALHDELDAIGLSGDIRAVVITGAGTAFCSGAGLPATMTQDPPAVITRRIHRTALKLHQLPQPTIAAVNGAAYGAGMSLALGCDIVLASSTATFCQVFVKRGLAPDFGSSWLLPRLVGLQTAKRLALLAEVLDAQTARELGLVTEVVQPDALAEAAQALARRLAAGPPVALALTKQLLNRSFASSFADQLDAEASGSGVTTATADAREAFSAFAEKRDPVFRGR
ncbi:enoyl-CoA hydratase/isomerase family protein [Nakamurella lactea]|uniref:enoyl-CoA hydratase/isomerase family protein n=1 Tax=Nakamurella lactea TaxID=459515 RepID=UPI000406C2C5|nr:enoyl-CoA hydratase-related protein [Nakamurella lactea]